MESKNSSLSTVFLVIAIIVIILMGVFIYMQKVEADEKITELENNASELQENINNLQGKIDSIRISTRPDFIDDKVLKTLKKFGVKSIELKGRPNDYVVGAKYVSEKDIVVILTNRGNIKRLRPEEINKGKKNNVGKMYLKVVKSNMHEAIDLEVIHAKNANGDLASYIFCENGFVEIDYTLLRTAIADNGKKFVSNSDGKPEEIVICRNDYDLEL